HLGQPLRHTALPGHPTEHLWALMSANSLSCMGHPGAHGRECAEHLRTPRPSLHEKASRITQVSLAYEGPGDVRRIAALRSWLHWKHHGHALAV
ncbi:MAG: hypothetical protein WCH11_06600, partial [Bdellovibrio sp.]